MAYVYQKRFKWKSFWFAYLLFLYFLQRSGLGGMLNLFHKHKTGDQNGREMLEIVMTFFYMLLNPKDLPKSSIWPIYLQS